jgi:hypothetical protein
MSDYTENELETMRAGKIGCLVVILSAPIAALRAWAIVTVWPWFLPGHITIHAAVGAIFMFRFVTAASTIGKKSEIDTKEFTLAKFLGEALLAPFMFIGMAWVLSAFAWWVER